MFKRELKINLKPCVIWLLSVMCLFLFAYIVYPFMIQDESFKDIENILNSMPKEFTKAFNMDLASITTVYGWIKSEGWMFVLIVFSVYASLLGSSIVLKEENDKTIDYLLSTPLNRKTIYFNKVLVGFIYIVILAFSFGIINILILLKEDNFILKEGIMLFISPIFVMIVFYSLCLFLSTFKNKIKQLTALSFGIVIASYFLNMIGGITKKLEFIKYFSFFTISDTRRILNGDGISIVAILISLLLTGCFVHLGYYRYSKKEFKN